MSAHTQIHINTKVHTQAHTGMLPKILRKTKHTQTHIWNTLRYKYKGTDTHKNVQRPTNILQDTHTQRCSHTHINTVA